MPAHRSAMARGPRSRRRPGEVNPAMRVSDAERAELADLLSKHFGDGRLDQAEFDERLDLAMKAKTQSDLAALLTDLPATVATGPAASPPRSRPGLGRRIAFLVLVAVVTALAAHALQVYYFFPGW
jgi:uncharacterized protein DUF1707